MVAGSAMFVDPDPAQTDGCLRQVGGLGSLICRPPEPRSRLAEVPCGELGPCHVEQQARRSNEPHLIVQLDRSCQELRGRLVRTARHQHSPRHAGTTPRLRRGWPDRDRSMRSRADDEPTPGRVRALPPRCVRARRRSARAAGPDPPTTCRTAPTRPTSRGRTCSGHRRGSARRPTRPDGGRRARPPGRCRPQPARGARGRADPASRPPPAPRAPTVSGHPVAAAGSS